MAPSLEEPINEALEAPLKNAPKLVAPEPGWSVLVTTKGFLGDVCLLTRLELQNIVLARNRSRLGKVMPAMAVQINQSAPPRQRDPILIFQS